MGANGKQPQPNNHPEFHGRSKVRKLLDTTHGADRSYVSDDDLFVLGELVVFGDMEANGEAS
jgi:hypothetical protein